MSQIKISQNRLLLIGLPGSIYLGFSFWN